MRVLPLIAVVLLVACNGKKPVLVTTPLRLGIPLQPSSALNIIAIEKGLFEKQGLQVSTKLYPSGKRALKDGLLLDSVDCISTAESPMADLGFKRSDGKVIATIYRSDNVNSVIARTDAGIKVPEDLIGKRIATQQNSAVHYFLTLFLIENDIPLDDVTFSFLKAEELPKALQNKEIDAFSMREPYITQAQNLIGDSVVVFREPGLYTQMEAVVLTGAYIQQNNEAVHKILRALIEAESFVKENPDEAAEIVAGKIKTSKEEILRNWERAQLAVTLDQVLINILEDQARWKLTITDDSLVIPNYLSIVSSSFLQMERPNAVSLIQ